MKSAVITGFAFCVTVWLLICRDYGNYQIYTSARHLSDLGTQLAIIAVFPTVIALLAGTCYSAYPDDPNFGSQEKWAIICSLSFIATHLVSYMFFWLIQT